MGRFSPTVLPDSRPRERPGLQIAEAFGRYRQAKGQEEEQAFRREDREFAAEDREEAGVDRTRRREQEDLEAGRRSFEFERLVRDELGGVPVRGDQEVPGPTPQAASGAFQDTRESLGAMAEPSARVDPSGAPPEEVAILPGQFAGGTFSPEAVMIGGQQFRIDPSQTLEARGRAEEDRVLQEEMDALRAADVPEDQLRAVAMFNLESEFVTPEEEAPEGFDPDQAGQFSTRKEYLAFQQALADAKDAVGRRPARAGEEGPLDLEAAFEEVDAIFGIWETGLDGKRFLSGHDLTEGERLTVARKLASGELKPDELDELKARGAPLEEEEIPLQFEAGPIKRLFQSITPGGKTGLETIGTPRTAQEAAEPREETSVVPSREPPAVDTIRGLIDEHSDMDPEELKKFLLEVFSEEEVAAAFAGR